MSKNVNFTVAGSKYGPFPMDMLRYDSAVAFSARDEMLIDDLNKDADAKRHLAKRVLVQLTTTQRGAPTIKRWESFGWEVTDCSDPSVDTTATRTKASLDRMGVRRASSTEVELFRDAVEAQMEIEREKGNDGLVAVLKSVADDDYTRTVLASAMVRVLDDQKRLAR